MECFGLLALPKRIKLVRRTDEENIQRKWNKTKAPIYKNDINETKCLALAVTTETK